MDSPSCPTQSLQSLATEVRLLAGVTFIPKTLFMPSHGILSYRKRLPICMTRFDEPQLEDPPFEGIPW